MITEPNVSITFRLTQEEKDQAKAIAAAKHQTMSQYVRDALRAQINQDIVNIQKVTQEELN